MNKIFGFFKEKITEAKQQNQQELQTIAQALNQNQYSKDKVLGVLQNAKTNYMNWNILIANEASTGLYYSQTHNRNICLKKIKGNKELVKNLDKNKIKLAQLQRTHQQLLNIGQLNGNWALEANQYADRIFQSLNKLQKSRKKPKQEAKSKQEQGQKIYQTIKEQQMDIVDQTSKEEPIRTKNKMGKIEDQQHKNQE